mgnify:CR=1 FL=1
MTLHAIDDFSQVRERIYSGVKQFFQNLPPIEDDEFRLELKDVDYSTERDYTPDDEQKAIIYNASLMRPLRARVRLIDKKTGRVVSEDTKRILAVPHLTDRGTFIVDGVEYSFEHQLRLRPGIYTRLTDRGDFEAHFNVVGSTAHRYIFDPESGRFYLTVKQARIPLFPILLALGFKERDLQQILGPKLYELNQTANDPKAVLHAATALSGRPINDGMEAAKILKNIYGSMRIDSDMTQFTLGVKKDKVDNDVLARVLQKLIAAARGEATLDDRNHLAFLRLYGPEDLILELIQKQLPQLRKYFNRVRARRDVKYLPSGFLDIAVNYLLFGSRLAVPLEEINLVEVYDTRHRVTRLGEGGIADVVQVADELRQLHPTHLNYLDPLLTPEGETVGVNTRLTYNLRRDKQGNIYKPFIDAKTGRTVWLSPKDLLNKVIAFPGEMESSRKYKYAIINNQHVIVTPKQVDYYVPQQSLLYSPLTNLVPFKANTYPQRVGMGARMIAQAVPLVEPEPPLVQNLDPVTQKSFDQLIGSTIGVRRSPVDGVVTQVRKDAIIIRDKKGVTHRVQIFRDFPFNRKTYYDEIPLVKAGDTVRVGQQLTYSNHTDPSGTLALGRNLKTAYMAWKGLNFEDAAVISESAAKKLTSTHLYQHTFDLTPDIHLGRTRFFSVFPTRYPREIFSNYTEEGFAKPGTILRKNDPIILALRETQPVLGKLSARRAFQDASLLWEYDDPGRVLAVGVTPKGINVLVKVEHPVRVGDKIAGRYGDKHIISTIVPDDQMPKDANGEPFELLLNPLGAERRVNLAQFWELLLAKIARRTGKPYLVPDHAQNSYEFVKQELEKAGMKDTEPVFVNGDTQAEVEDVLTGYRYMMKLHHMAEHKLSGRALGGYSAEETPVKESGAKRVGLLEMLAILAHGAYHVARDARVVRGQKNEDLWTRVMLGYDVPKFVDTPIVYTKFLHQLIAAGLYPREQQGLLSFYALTDDDIKRMVGNRLIKNDELVELRDNNIEIRPGGLFDETITGGLQGTFWSGIKLAVPLPNPLMEPVIKSLLGLSEKEFLAVLRGERNLGDFGTGPEALKKALASINVKKELETLEQAIRDKKVKELDAAYRKVRYLRAMDQYRVRPDQFIWSIAPVLPPIFRPVNLLAKSRLVMADDVNYLYKDLMTINLSAQSLKELNALDGDDIEILYNALRAVIGLADPIHPKYKMQKIKGVIPKIIGNTPKEGVVQRKLLGALVEMVGRATIIPNPDLSIDEIALPEDLAWEVYRPLIIRRLLRHGATFTQAVELFENRHETARDALIAEMNSRPVIVSRAPVLHKFGVQAFWPKLTKNNVIEIPPPLVTGFGADFDGDAMQFHVPIDPAAVKEAIEKLLPSKNLIAFQKFEAHIVPTLEYALGLYFLSKAQPNTKKPVQRFPDAKSLIMAVITRKVDPDQPVVVERIK